MKKFYAIIIPILLVVLILVVVVLKQHHAAPPINTSNPNSRTASSTIPTPSDTNTIIPTILFATSTVDTTDWKVYDNTQYGFAFKFPSDWNLRKGNSESQIVFDSSTSTNALSFEINEDILSVPEIRGDIPHGVTSIKNLDDFFNYTQTQRKQGQIYAFDLIGSINLDGKKAYYYDINGDYIKTYYIITELADGKVLTLAFTSTNSVSGVVNSFRFLK